MAKAKRSADKAQAYRKSFNLAALTAVILAIVCTVGGTLAWIVSVPDPVVNTFTYGEIEISLVETDSNLDEDNNPETNTYMMAPGIEIKKDPTVTVKAGSEACWLFVKLEKSANFDEFMTCEYADGWTELAGTDDSAVILYRKVDSPKNDAEFGVLKDDKVTVKDITDDMLNALGSDDGENPYPTLDITAYAVQYMGFEENAYGAWAAIEPNGEPPAAGNSTENNNGSTVSDSAAAAAYSATAPRFYWGEDSIFTIKGKE